MYKKFRSVLDTDAQASDTPDSAATNKDMLGSLAYSYNRDRDWSIVRKIKMI
jgi:hypothetical protein